uniref:Uncharacterized protein n=1 Tax=Panagrolaimus sp. PS1159 TaxID=55785 RepID=A0AC35GS77_9BILA
MSAVFGISDEISDGNDQLSWTAINKCSFEKAEGAPVRAFKLIEKVKIAVVPFTCSSVVNDSKFAAEAIRAAKDVNEIKIENLPVEVIKFAAADNFIAENGNISTNNIKLVHSFNLEVFNELKNEDDAIMHQVDEVPSRKILDDEVVKFIVNKVSPDKKFNNNLEGKLCENRRMVNIQEFCVTFKVGYCDSAFEDKCFENGLLLLRCQNRYIPKADEIILRKPPVMEAKREEDDINLRKKGVVVNNLEFKGYNVVAAIMYLKLDLLLDNLNVLQILVKSSIDSENRFKKFVMPKDKEIIVRVYVAKLLAVYTLIVFAGEDEENLHVKSSKMKLQVVNLSDEIAKDSSNICVSPLVTEVKFNFAELMVAALRVFNLSAPSKGFYENIVLVELLKKF